MSQLPLFHGSLTALITPLNADGSVDFQSLEKLVAMHLEAGTHGIVVMGTTGEASTMTTDEYLAVIKKVVDLVDKRIAVIAGTGKNCTADAIVTVEKLAKIGVDACLSVTPYYNKPTQEGLYQHFKAIANSTAIPQILYNVPSRTGVDLLPETVARLSQIPNIIGIKEATGKVERVAEIKQLAGEEFILLSGDDATGLEFIRLGGDGVISVTNNLAPAEMAKMCELALAGNFEEAEKIQHQLMPLHQNLFVESNPIPVKWCAYKLNLIATPTMRLPLTTLSKASQSVLLDALNACNLNGLAVRQGLWAKIKSIFA